MKISIIMPAYNASKTIRDSIESVLRQDFEDWELIVVNDKSVDDTLEILSTYSDPRIKIINLEKNGGAANARNVAIREAKGKYVAFLDSDDIWYDMKLSKQYEFMESNGHLFTYTNHDVFVGTLDNIKNTRIYSSEVSYEKLLKGNQIGCLTVMIDSTIIKKYPMPNIRHEDYATWLQVLRDEKILAYNIGEVLAYYRVHSNSLSGNKIKTASWQWNIYRNHFGIGYIRSAYYFVYYVINAVIKRI